MSKKPIFTLTVDRRSGSRPIVEIQVDPRLGEIVRAMKLTSSDIGQVQMSDLSVHEDYQSVKRDVMVTSLDSHVLVDADGSGPSFRLDRGISALGFLRLDSIQRGEKTTLVLPAVTNDRLADKCKAVEIAISKFFRHYCSEFHHEISLSAADLKGAI